MPDTATTERCPQCEADRPLHILYGYLTGATMRAAARGELALGGCVVLLPSPPNRQCRRCLTRWPAARNDEQAP